MFNPNSPIEVRSEISKALKGSISYLVNEVAAVSLNGEITNGTFVAIKNVEFDRITFAAMGPNGEVWAHFVGSLSEEAWALQQN